jgi:penicillin-binding protein 1A
MRTRKNYRVRNIILLVTLLGVLLLVAVGYRTLQIYHSELPSFEQLHNIEPSLKTKVYDRNGILLKEFYSENRALTPFKDFPPHLVAMTLAIEDQEFYDHWGINIRRAAIVAVRNLLNWEIAAGASTISMQLSRMLFLTQERTFERKIKEALTTIKLERTYSKEEILEMYLNQYYFSRGAYGIAAAAHAFFDKMPSELDHNECAILVGLFKGPNINSPFNNPDKALRARNRVLHAFHRQDGLPQELYDSLVNEPLRISPPEEEIGTAPYFTETVRRHILDTYGESVLYSGGLKVHTSLDAGLQEAAEAATYKKVDSLRARIERTFRLDNPHYTEFLPDTVDEFGDSIRVHKKVQGAFVAIDNATGDVLALVGGRSFEESKWNRAVQATLQPGSAFKPFLYTACIDNGYKTTDIVDDNPIVLDIPGAKQFRPHNYDDRFLGPITVREAISQSRNLVAVRLILKVTPAEPIFYAHRMGITTDLRAVPSLAIGTSEVRLVELVSAFSTFPNRGLHIPYRMIHRIVDRYGKVLEDNTAVIKEEVLSAQTAYVMVDLMRSVLDGRKGTGRRTRWMGFTRPAGGKTGTTDNFCDNWFVGYSPQITAGAWVGFDEKTSLGRNQDGAKNGVPIWTEFMIAAHDSLPIMDFERPDGIVEADVCLESGEIATDRCLKVRREIFVAGTEPLKTCHIHPSRGLYVPTAKVEDFIVEDTAEDRTHF